MASPPTLTCGTLAEASMLRREAHELLNRLVANRDVTERRLQETGRRDPIRTVTGTTAIERAIASTRGMIADMDVLLAELDHGIDVAEADNRPEADDAARKQTATILMHGNVHGLTAVEALTAVMAATTLRFELPEGVIRVSSARESSAPSS